MSVELLDEIELESLISLSTMVIVDLSYRQLVNIGTDECDIECTGNSLSNRICHVRSQGRDGFRKSGSNRTEFSHLIEAQRCILK